MSEKSGSALAATGAVVTETLSANLGEVRRVLAGEVKLRSTVIKPLENALRALKDPHRSLSMPFRSTSSQISRRSMRL